MGSYAFLKKIKGREGEIEEREGGKKEGRRGVWEGKEEFRPTGKHTFCVATERCSRGEKQGQRAGSLKGAGTENNS